MNYVVISFSHKSCEIETREKLALDSDAKKTALLEKLVCYESINEGIVLSTCNRVEMILSVSNVYDATQFTMKAVSQYSGIEYYELEGRAEIFEDEGAVHHLFSVISSLDSLVVGESQITGQLKDAFRFSYDRGFCAQKLSRVMHYAFKCAAEVRTSTSISENKVSISSVAVDMAAQKAGSLEGKTALILGAGEMSTHAIRNLAKHGVKMRLISRDYNKAKEYVKGFECDLTPCRSYELQAQLNRCELLFSATSSPDPVVTREMVEEQNFRRYWFDIAVPGDIDEIDVNGVDVYKVDDLKEIVAQNITQRQRYAKEAFKIVGRYTVAFFKWLEELSVEPLIKQIRLQADEAIQKELQRCLEKGFLPKEYEANMEKAMQNAMNRFLHNPTKFLRNHSEESKTDTMIESLQSFFSIKDIDSAPDRYKCEHETK